jgi:hypothetical protein
VRSRRPAADVAGCEKLGNQDPRVSEGLLVGLGVDSDRRIEAATQALEPSLARPPGEELGGVAPTDAQG